MCTGPGDMQGLLFDEYSNRVVQQVIALAVVIERYLEGFLRVHGRPFPLCSADPIILTVSQQSAVCLPSRPIDAALLMSKPY